MLAISEQPNFSVTDTENHPPYLLFTKGQMCNTECAIFISIFDFNQTFNSLNILDGFMVLGLCSGNHTTKDLLHLISYVIWIFNDVHKNVFLFLRLINLFIYNQEMFFRFSSPETFVFQFAFPSYFKLFLSNHVSVWKYRDDFIKTSQTFITCTFYIL